MKEKLKVLYLSPNGFLGGAETFVLNINQCHLNSSKIESEILFLNDGIAISEANKRGIKTHLIKTKFRFRNPFKLLRAIFEIRNYIKDKKIDILQTTMSYGHIVGSLATIGIPVKKFWFNHGPVGSYLDRWAHLFSNDGILYPSQYTLDSHRQLLPMFSRYRHKDEVVKYGVPFKTINNDEVKAIQNEFTPNGELLITMAGRITPWKGQDILIRALLKLQKTPLLENTKVLILGDINSEKDRPYLDSIQNLVKSNGLDGHVLFPGFKSNVYQFLAASDLVVHASTIPEPWGLVVAEAMSTGTLVLGGAKGGIADMLIDGKTGFTYDSTAQNADELLSAKLKLILQQFKNKEREEIKKISTQGKCFIEEQYSLEQLQKHMEDIFEGNDNLMPYTN